MKIHFHLRFHTWPGQNLFIKGNIEQLGNHLVRQAAPMQYLNDQLWQTSIEIDDTKPVKINYTYVLNDIDGAQIIEGERNREITIPVNDIKEIYTIDTWNHEGAYENVFFTSPFQNVLLPATDFRVKLKAPKQYTHVFKVKAPLLKKNEVICLVGSSIILGEWKGENSLILSRDGDWWSVKVNIPPGNTPLEYKYCIYNTRTKKFGMIEGYENRQLPANGSAGSVTILHDGFARFPNTTWKGAGTAIPVFSLKSRKSFGVGEFADIRLLVDWAKEVGLKLIQILPVNDTSATHTNADSYPYAAISAFALHPMYINLEKVAGKSKASVVKKLKKKQKQLNEAPELDYEQVISVKLTALKELCLAQKQDLLDDKDFYTFCVTHRHWLIPYAAFCYLRDKNGTADCSQWKQHNEYNKEAIEKFVSIKAKHYDEIFFHYFTQYHLHLQLKEAADYAHKKGIILKGDIPIGVYRHSCDAWMSPELYHMDMQAGAPPDDFAVKGQNWGFPTYNWQKMQEDDFSWWRRRFEQMSHYFDAFRIDHILGFFRIWSVPVDAVEGIMGYFVPAIPVTASEFIERGIDFDNGRYTKPFIDEYVLQQFFGELTDKVKESFLDAASDGRFLLKDAFNTQRKVETHFSTLEVTGQHNSIRQGLFDLLANVILFEAPGLDGTQYHFRIDVEETLSFNNLDEHTKAQVKELYVNYFFRRQDDHWKKEAMKKLPSLKASTNMLICGEDLGMVPSGVPELMSQLGILSLEIQRMPKNPNREFFHPDDAPYLSVVTPSTHDMSTIRGWWTEDLEKTQRFYNNELKQWGNAPLSCDAWINKAIVLQHLHSPAMWSIFQLQDILGMSNSLRRENPDEERINVPADPKHYWRYRMHFTLEHLLKEKEFNRDLKSDIHESGR